MPRPAWIDDLVAAIDAADADRFVSFLTEDAEFHMGNAPAIHGRDAIHSAVTGFWGSIDSSEHDIEEVWTTPEGVLLRGTVSYVRQDGTGLTVPFANVFHLDDGKIRRYLVYADVSEL